MGTQSEPLDMVSGSLTDTELKITLITIASCGLTLVYTILVVKAA